MRASAGSTENRISHQTNTIRWGVQNHLHHNANPEQIITRDNNTYQLRRKTQEYMQQQKQKNNQIISRMQALRNQHQILKGTNIQSSQLRVSHHKHRLTEQNLSVHSHKSKNKSHSNHHHHNTKRLNSSASVADMKKHKILKRKQFINPSTFLNIEKQQLQIQLNSTMKKLEQSLQREINLKKSIYQLQNRVFNLTNQISTQPVLHKPNINNEQTLKNQINILQIKNKQMINKIGKLQGDKAALEYELQNFKEKIRNNNTEIYELKMKFEMNLLEHEKIQKQKQISIRNYVHEIQILKSIPKQKNHANQLYQQRIKQLQEQLLSKQRSNYEPVTQNHNMNSQKLVRLLNQLTQKMNKSSVSQKQSSVQLQLNSLKNQIFQSLRKKQKDSGDISLQSKILSLEQTINFENKQKQKFMNELKKIAHELDQYKKMYEQLNFQYESMREQFEIRRKKLQAQLEESKKYSQIPNINLLKSKIQQQQQQINRLNQQLFNNKNKSKIIEQAQITQIRQLRSRVNQAQIWAKRYESQKNLGLQMTKRQMLNNQHAFKYNINQVVAQSNAWKQQFSELKQKYDSLWLKTSNLENQKIQTFQLITRQRQSQAKIFKQAHQRQLETLRQKYLKDQEALIQQLDRLKKTHQMQSEIVRKYASLQAEVIELRKMVAKTHSTRTNIFHLWEIKEVQYNNINQIIQQTKKNQLFIPKIQNTIQKKPFMFHDSRPVSQPSHIVQPVSYNRQQDNSAYIENTHSISNSNHPSSQYRNQQSQHL